MAVLTFASLIAAVCVPFGYDKLIYMIALIIMNVGLVATLINRLYLMTHADKEL